MRSISFLLSLVFIFTIPWEGVIDIPGLGTAAKIMGAAMLAFWIPTVVKRRGFRKPALFHFVVLCFFLWNAASVLWSADPYQTAIKLLTWIQLLVLVFILWDLYTSRAAVFSGLQAFILGEYVAIGSAINNFFSGNVFYTHYQRFSPADQSNPDGFGIIVALGIPVAWYLATSCNTNQISRLLKWVNYAYIPAAFLGIVLSGTRTALIAAIPAMAFGLSSLTRLRLSARIAILLLLISAIIILFPHVQSLRSFQRFGTTMTEITEGDLNNRVNNWHEGLASFAHHPLIGVGTNMYRSVNNLGKLAHNSFISVLVELGLIGFTLFGIILTIAVMEAWGQRRWDSRFWLTVLVVWAICASSLTYEYRKATWLFLSLLISNAALTGYLDEPVEAGWSNSSEVHVAPKTAHSP